MDLFLSGLVAGAVAAVALMLVGAFAYAWIEESKGNHEHL